VRRYRLLWLGVLIVAFIAWSGAAFAAEPTLLQWWQGMFGSSSLPNNYDLNGDFPNAPYASGWNDEAALANLTSHSWWDGWAGYTYLHVEYAGWQSHTDFGIYDVSDVGESASDTYTAYPGTTWGGNNAPAQTDAARLAAGLVEIFDGGDSPGTYYPGSPKASPPPWDASNTFTVPEDEFGFWLDSRADTANVSQGIWFTNPLLNDAVDDTRGEKDNDVGDLTTPYQQCRVFQHPDYDTGWGWIMAWADWDVSQVEYQNNMTYEPDWNDLIVSLVRLDQNYNANFEDSPELGTWALLLCTGALGGWIRRRRR